MPLICPVDHALMTPRFFFGVEIDVCPKCGGVWMDDGELVRLGEASHDALQHIDRNNDPVVPRIESRPQRELRCPRDGETMSGYQFSYNSGIELDCCPKCNGIFIDDGELKSIADFKASGGQYKAADPEKVAAMRAKRHEREFGSKDQRKLPPEAAEMLATLQGQAARDRQRQEDLLRIGSYRYHFGFGLFGLLLEALLDRRQY